MRWQDREESENVDDRRGMGRTAGVAIGGTGALVVIILALVFGVDPRQLLAPGGQPGQPGQVGAPAEEREVDPEEEQLARFSKVIFGDTERVWTRLFAAMGRQYQEPTLVLFSGEVDSACGMANAAVGPFYCGGDGNVYIDLAFYRDMQRKLNAPGEFARAYVLAHEVGHHVQRLLGYSDLAEQGRFAQSPREKKQMSVRIELQADYLAGVWAHHAQEQFDFLERGDLESALNAAFQIGDDRLQKQAQGYVVPDTFTHGTSEQRQRWFEKGFETGDVDRAKQLFELDYEEL